MVVNPEANAFVALTSPAVAFSKATIAFPKLLVTFSDNAPAALYHQLSIS
jgi:hypothetical protein